VVAETVVMTVAMTVVTSAPRMIAAANPLQ
jgi:hypothetical protein